MQISFTLCLPRDEASVPVVRHISRDALSMLGVEAGCVADIELAVTEACSNVLRHAQGSDTEYEVVVEIDETRCEISVKDAGPGGGQGFDGGSAGRRRSEDLAENGRGIFLMRALVDDLEFTSEPDFGTVVRLKKALGYEPSSPMGILTARKRDREASLGDDNGDHAGERSVTR